MKRYTILIFFFFLNYYSSSQNLDSLLQVARNTKNDSIKLRMFNKIAFSYIFNNTNKAIQVIEEGKKISIEKNFKFGIAELTNTHGVYMDVIGQSDSAGYYFNKALDFSRKHKIYKVESMCVNNLGMYNWNRGNYNEALKFFFESLRLSEKFEDRKSTAIRLNNIGLIYQEMGLIDKALEHHQKAFKIRQEFKLLKDQATSLNNIGICYKEIGKIDKAIKTYNEGLQIALKSDNLRDYFRILDNLGNAYQLNKEYTKAIDAHLKSLNKPEKFNVDIKSEMITCANLTALFNQIENPRKALVYSEKGLNILKENPHLENYAGELYLNTAESNYMLDQYNEARVFKDKFITLKDSIFSESNAKTLAKLEVKYETEKKEKEILLQRAEIAEKDLKIQKRGFQIYGLIGLALLIGLFGFLFFRQQKIKNSQIKKENQLKIALAKIELQNRLQEQRLRISRDLHDNIGAQLTFIISSLENLKYAFDLPDKLRSRLDNIGEFTTSTIFELRDTIWAMNKTSISFEDLQSRISNFVDKADMSAKDIDFSINVINKKSLEYNFTSIQGINIYRVIQEALNNAIKYSKASKINIDIQSKKESFIISVIDNGMGFDKNKIEYGNGLNNIEKRALELNGTVAIISEINKGTQIVLSVPVVL